MKQCMMLVLAVALLSSFTACKEEKVMNSLKGKKVVMVIAHREFRDEEFAEPLNVLTKAGAEVTVASSALDPALGMLGKTAPVNLLVSDIVVSNYDAVIFVGGGGAREYFNDVVAHEIARQTVAQGKLLAAICIAPATLANAGVLKGKQATCFASVAGVLKKGGATVLDQGVVRDGRLVTADGPESAAAFARTVAEALESH